MTISQSSTWLLLVGMLLYLTVPATSTRVYPQAGVVLKKQGYTIVFDQVESIAVNIRITKPDLNIPDFVTKHIELLESTYGELLIHNSSFPQLQVLQSYAPLIETLRRDVKTDEDELSSWIKDESDPYASLLRSGIWYDTYEDEDKKNRAKELGEKELDMVDPAAWEKIDGYYQIKTGKHLLAVQEEIVNYEREELFPLQKLGGGDDKSVYWDYLLYSMKQTRYAERYKTRLDELIDAVSQASRPLSHRQPLNPLLSFDLLKTFVRKHDIFNGTIFKGESVFHLAQFAEILALNLTITDSYLSLFGLITFPVIREDNIHPQYSLEQLGYMFTREGRTRCVVHDLPDSVTLMGENYYELKCGQRMPGLCRVNLFNLNFQKSCFNGQRVTCMKFPVECEKAKYLEFNEGVLVSTAQRVRVAGVESQTLEEVEKSEGSTFIPWQGASSVLVGDGLLINPDVGSAKDSSNKSIVFNIDIQYSQIDLTLLLKSNINVTSRSLNREALIRYMGEMSQEMEDRAKEILEQKRQAEMSVIISSCISVVGILVMAVVYGCVKNKFRWCSFSRSYWQATTHV